MSDEPKKKSPHDLVAELEERREKKHAVEAEAEAEQYAVDLVARGELEDEHGPLTGIRVRFARGVPTRAYVKTPEPGHYRRYLDQVGRAVKTSNTKATREAQELLAKVCWVYPRDAEGRDAMLARFPGLLTTIGIEAAKLGEGQAEAEGKG